MRNSSETDFDPQYLIVILIICKRPKRDTQVSFLCLFVCFFTVQNGFLGFIIIDKLFFNNLTVYFIRLFSL